VVLDHVPQRPRALVVGAPVLDPDLLGHGHLHVIDVAPVPDRLEEGIGESERQDVLHRLLPEVVVDPENLGLVEHRGENPVQRPGGFQVPPEGLLHHDARPRAVAGQARSRQPGRDDLEEGGRRRQVVDDEGIQIPPAALLLEQPGKHPVGLGRAEIRGPITEVGGEEAPRVVVGPPAAGKLVDPGAEACPELLVAHRLEVQADDGKALGHPPVHEEGVQGRHELAPREVARRTEDDDDDGVRLRQGLHRPARVCAAWLRPVHGSSHRV